MCICIPNKKKCSFSGDLQISLGPRSRKLLLKRAFFLNLPLLLKTKLTSASCSLQWRSYSWKRNHILPKKVFHWTLTWFWSGFLFHWLPRMSWISPKSQRPSCWLLRCHETPFGKIPMRKQITERLLLSHLCLTKIQTHKYKRKYKYKYKYKYKHKYKYKQQIKTTARNTHF